MAESDKAAVSRLTAQFMSAFIQGMTSRHTRFPPVDEGVVVQAVKLAKMTLECFEASYEGASVQGYARTEGERQAMMYRAEHPTNGPDEPPEAPLTQDAAVRSEARRLAQMEGRDPDEVPSAGSGVGVPTPVAPAPGIPVEAMAQARSPETGRFEAESSGAEPQESGTEHGGASSPEPPPPSDETDRPTSAKRTPRG